MLKKVGLVLVIVLVLSALCYGEVKKTVAQIILKTQTEKQSYSIGLNIGKSLQKQEINLDQQLLVKGLMDGFTNANPLLTETEIKEVYAAMQQEINAKQAESFVKLGMQNKKDGDQFLAANKAKEGIVTLPSGLQYKELKAGTGPFPSANDTVTVNYRGTLIDGTEFDNSYKRGQPLQISVSGVILGWREALQLMKAGAKWQLFIPSDLTYGVNGAGQLIGPNTVLVFEVELITIDTPDNANQKPDPKK